MLLFLHEIDMSLVKCSLGFTVMFGRVRISEAESSLGWTNELVTRIFRMAESGINMDHVFM